MKARNPIFVLRLALLISPVIAVIVVMTNVAREYERAWICAFLAAAWLSALASGARGRGPVAAAACAGVLATVPWGFVFYASSKPCGYWGDGVLTPDPPDCPLAAVHFVNFFVGGGSWLALLTGVVAGMQYVGGSNERARKVFSGALLIASALVLAWLVAQRLLPAATPAIS